MISLRSRLLVPALVLLAAVFGRSASGASFPPGLRFRSLETPRITLHFHQGLEAQARQAAALAEQILERHEARYGVHIRRLHVVLADVDDSPNGFSTPLPYPLVQVRAAAPDGTDDFGNYDGWLRLVLTHELAHSVHLEQGRGLIHAGRKVFGRAPFLFPNVLTPIWMLEGLATYEETEGTLFGRGRNPDSRMVLRMAALDGGLPPEDVAAVFPDVWPQGQAPYLFGEGFLRDLSGHDGPSALPDLARVHSRQVVPFTDDRTAHKVTGATFHARWQDWTIRSADAFAREAQRIRERGVTPSRALTARGIVQTGPRFSPDGAWIAYTSRSLTRYRGIRLVRTDGSGDRALVDRNGGEALAWTPDGRSLVYDEPEVHRLFASRSDLRSVDVASGRVRRLTRGLRARDPDVAPNGRRVVFVRRFVDRSELWTLDLAGGEPRVLAASAPETQWSDPHFAPDGASVVAVRWLPGGWLDLVQVDAASGSLTALTHDRAREMQPSVTPDGRYVVFRSDRDGVSNLYALRLADRAVLRLTNVVGGAFEPSVSPDGRSVAFADYSARGYDIHVMDGVDWDALEPAAPFEDAIGTPQPLPEPVSVDSRPYRPLPAMLPRFWSPYVARAGEWQVGALTAGVDPLFRHAYGLQVSEGADTHRTSGQGFYQYDRFWPTLLLTGSDKTELLSAAPGRPASVPQRTQELGVRLTFPLVRSFHASQDASVAWRYKRESVTGAERNEGGVELAWALGSARQYPFSISPVEGWRLRVAYLKESEALGSDVSLGKLTADARTYTRVFGKTDALALRAGGGTTFGRPAFRRSFRIGGFPDGSLFDLGGANLSVLRGYPDDAFAGRSFVHANVEYRVPLAHPQRGYWSLPGFARHLHAAVFADAAHAWNGSFRLDDVKTAAGVALGADTIVGHGLPLTLTAGIAHGFAEGGETRPYFRLGLAF